MSLWRVGVTISVMGFAAACRPPAPTPSLNTDLGTDGEILLPTPAAWHYKDVQKGTSEWRPFRKPGETAKAEEEAEATAKPASAAGAVGPEKEIRETVAEFNAMVAEGKFADAFEFLIQEHVAIAEQAVAEFPAYAEKLRELGEAAPACKEQVDRLLPFFGVSDVFTFGVADLMMNGEREATGKIVDPKSGKTPPGMERFTVHFTKDAEGYWFIDSGHITQLKDTVASLQDSAQGLSMLTSAIRSGEVTGDSLDAMTTTLNEKLEKMYRILSGPGESKPNDNG